MRLKHNKKRNTAFLFEALTREYVMSVVKKNVQKQTAIRKIIKEHFCKGPLKQELSIYRELLESKELTEQEARFILEESKKRYSDINRREVFNSQNRLIKEINHTLSSSVFGNFVPNYKDLATVYNIFNNKTTMKEKIILEDRMVESLKSEVSESKEHIDNLTYKTFVNKFNEKYSDLPDNQKELLNNYIASFSGDDLSLKSCLNEQISELKEKMVSYKQDKRLDNEELNEKFNKVYEKLESYKDQKIDDIMISEVLMVQELVRELGDA